nr:reverse transcriptase domain-containing protein [Tanacetum cinerariifolium]
MAPVTRRGPNTPPNNINPNNMTPESVQAMIDQALLRNFTNEDGSHRTEGVGEIRKLEIELWNLKVKGNDVATYTGRFQELTLICTKFVANETEKINKYINGLPNNIYGSVKASKPKTLDETIELANDLMDQKLRTYAERQTKNKRKANDSSRNNHGHQQHAYILADKTIISCADNRPPMLEKDMYDSWKSIMEQYMLNRQHGRMILESVENGPLLWLTVKENGVTQLNKYSELSTTKAIQADCDVKATNIILQGLPPEVYALVSTHKVAKELWERIQMLM